MQLIHFIVDMAKEILNIIFALGGSEVNLQLKLKISNLCNSLIFQFPIFPSLQ